MAANSKLQRVNEWSGLRGFANLFHKEHRAWWCTHRWWINALIWTFSLGGLTTFILFGPKEQATQATETGLPDAVGLIAYVLSQGLSIFFEFGMPMLAIGTAVLTQDLIIGEKHSGVMDWLLSKPVVRRSYVLAKLAANSLAVQVLLVGLPSVMVYGMLSLRVGAPIPMGPFLSAVGIMAIHTLFYLTLTLMLGTVFNNRGPILGIALGSVLGGGILGGFIKPLLFVTPWILPKAAWSIAAGQALPTEIGLASLVATALWSLVFILVALWKIEKTEF
jgi:ABC-2 type transport system permease protein